MTENTSKPFNPCADYPWNSFELLPILNAVLNESGGSYADEHILPGPNQGKWTCKSCGKLILPGNVCLGEGNPWRFWVRCECCYASVIAPPDGFNSDPPPLVIERIVKFVSANYIKQRKKSEETEEEIPPEPSKLTPLSRCCFGQRTFKIISRVVDNCEGLLDLYSRKRLRGIRGVGEKTVGIIRNGLIRSGHLNGE